MKKALLSLTMAVLLGLSFAPLGAQGSLSEQVLRLLTRDNSWTGVNTFDDTVGVKLDRGLGAPIGGTTDRLYNIGGNLYWNGSTVTAGGGGVGTVTSVAMTVPSIFSLSGSPITGAGTLAVTLQTQAASLVFAAPLVGGTPTFRALADADIPNTITIAGTGNVTWASVDKTGSSLADLATRSASDLSSGTLALARITDDATANKVLLSGGGGGDPQWGTFDASVLTGTLDASLLPAFTGDVTTSAGSTVTTLANSGASAGTYGSGAAVPVITVNAKGLITSISETSLTAHALLSATHTDTVAAAVARGAVIVGNSAPAWAKVTPSVTGSVLRYDGTDTAFSTDGSGLTSLSATNISSGTLGVARGGTALSSVPTNGQLLIGNGTNYTLAGLTGTASQITVTNGVGSITLSTPQGIATTSTPQFARLGLGGGPGSSEVLKLYGQVNAGLYDNGNCGAADTVDWNNGGRQLATLTAATCTFTFQNPVLGTYVLLVKQDGTGSRLVSWPGTIKWKGGAAPTLTTTASKTDLCTFEYDGTNYLGQCDLNY